MDSLPVDHFITELQFTKTIHKDVYPAIDPTSPALNIDGKTVIITGASRGIGAKGIASAFVKAGAKALVLVATNAQKLNEVEASLQSVKPNLQVLTVECDISSVASVEKLFAEVKTKFGYADVLVNSAGLNVAQGNIHEIDAEEWWSNFNVNIKGTFLLAQHLIKSLPSPSTPATIINLSTSGVWQIHPTISGYCLSKLAAMQLTTFLEAAYPNITAVSLHPGMVETDMLMPVFARFELTPPEMIGALCVWLCSEKAKFLSGRLIAAHWDVDELYARREEIKDGKLLQMDLVGQFGKKYFQ